METTATMLDYIEECPELITRNLQNSQQMTQALVEEYCAGDYQTIWIVASGSSANAAYCARYFMRKYLKNEVKVITPFTFIHAEHDFGPQDFVFVVSQSGYSTNTIEAVDLLRQQGRRGLALTMDINSEIKNHADLVIDFLHSIEKVGYVTKGVIGLILFLFLFTIEAALATDRVSSQQADDLKAEIRKTAALNSEVLIKTQAFYQANFLALTAINKTYVCGLGSGLGIAKEAALKISETVQIPAMAIEAEEYLHGITLQITPVTTTYLIDVGLAPERIAAIYRANQLATPNTFLITNDPKFQQDKTALVINSEVTAEILPLVYLPFFQYIAYQVTEDTHRWEKHPAYDRMKDAIAAKAANYEQRFD